MKPFFTITISTALLLLMSTSLWAQPAPPYSQNWTDLNLIAVNDDWSGIVGVVGYRGDNLTAATGVDPQTVVATGDTTPVDVNANQTNPNTFTSGGVTEFEIGDPVIALTGSGTADAPHIVISVNSTGMTNINVSYDLRDIDGSTDNAVQPVALQYRVGSTGDFTNVPAGFVADASTGPSLATLITPVSVALPTAVDNVPLLQIRVITTNAVGNDEWIGIDNINVTSGPVPIQLSSFTGTLTNNGAVQLRWTTISEINNYGFYVERRSSNAPAYSEILGSFVSGFGTTNTPQHYTYIDNTVTPGTWSYRLKQVDLDNTVHYTEPIEINVLSYTSVSNDAPKVFELQQNYPNPFNPATEIQFSVETTGKTTLEVYNLVGRKVATLFNDVAEAGHYYKARLDGKGIASGMYFYRLQSGMRTEVRKMTLLK